MIEQGFFNKHFVGRDGFQWWIGQIPNADVWQLNIPGTRVSGNNSVQGFGQRYKVRIMGYHTANGTDLPDEDLPWASVMYPVTAGSGNNGSSQSVNILQGDFVYGFFLDGEDGQQPVIMGVAGFNEYQAVMKNVPDTKFVPFLGLKPEVPDNGFLARGIQRQGGGQTVLRQTNAQGEVANTSAIVAATLGLEDQDKATAEADDTTERQEEALAQPSECEPLPIGKMQQQIRNSIQRIEKIKKSLYDAEAGALEFLGNEQQKIDNEIEKASEFIASSMKWVYEQVEAFITDKTNEALKTVYDIAHPNERNLVKQTSNKILDTIACFFRKLIAQLVKMVGSFLKDAANKVINVPTCFVENFAGSVIGTVGGAVDGMFQGIESLISNAVDVADMGIDLAGDALGLLDNLLSALTCDDRPECSKINKWNIRAGAGGITSADVTNIFENAKNVVTEVQGLGTDALDAFDGLTNIDLGPIFNSTDSCDTGPITCGPPGVEFFGSDGAGALGNAVIGAAGEVLAIDMLSFGAGYDANTRAKVVDPCGKGKGAVVKPVFGPVPRSGRSEFPDGEEERQVVGKNVTSTIKASKRRAKVGETVIISWNVTDAEKVLAKGQGFQGQVASDQFSGSVDITVKKGFKSYSIIGVGEEDRVEANVVIEGTIGQPRPQVNTPFGPGEYRPSAPGEGVQINPDFPSNPGLLNQPGGGGGGGVPPLGFGPFDANPYTFPGELVPTGARSPAPFNPTGGIFETPAFGLGPSLNIASPVDVRDPQSVLPAEARFDLDTLDDGVPVEFVVGRWANLNNRMTFRMEGLDDDNLGDYQGTGELSFSFTGNDLFNQEGEGEIKLIRPDTNYIVTGYLPTGEKTPNPLKIVKPREGLNKRGKPRQGFVPVDTLDNGKSIGLDDVFGRKEYQVTETFTRIERGAAGEAEIIWNLGNARERTLFESSPDTYFRDKISDGNKKIKLLDGDGSDTNATFTIVDGNGRFSDDGLKVIGTGRIEIELKWKDKKEIADLAIDSITVTAVHAGEDKTWTQTEDGKEDGENVNEGKDLESFTIDPVDREITETITRTERDEGRSDFDYQDLVVTVDKGKFTLRDDGTAVFRVSSNVPTGPGDGAPIDPGPTGQPFIDRGVEGTLSPGGDDIGIVDVIVIDSGTGFISGPDGSKGGDGRIWANPGDTIVQRPDGVWEIPIPPGNRFCFLPGDRVTLPAGTQVTTEPNDGVGGGELIIGGSVHIMVKAGCITTPDGGAGPPARTYPVVLYLCDIIIRNRGFGYTPGDKVVIEPSYGATAEATFDRLGRVRTVTITNSGEGFKVRPNIYIQSETGYNAELIPKLCIDRINDVNQPDDLEAIINVVDCVGLTPNGYLNNEPYYGPFHEHEGRRMVGERHSGTKHEYITQRQLDTFLNNPNVT